MTRDEEQLNLLAIFHYIIAGLTALSACIPIVHLVVGIVFIVSPPKMEGPGAEQFPPWFGWIFVIMALIFITLGWILAILIFTAGRSLAKRQRHTFCLVVAGIECLFMPFGTILGVFTIIVLMRDTVKPLFNGAQPISSVD